VIRLLPSKTSPLDCLPVSLLKMAADVMAQPLARLANLSLAAGIFPSRYKLGHVIPLLKKPGMSKKDPASYRPITNLSTFSKILEKLVLVGASPAACTRYWKSEPFTVSLQAGPFNGICAIEGGR